MKPSAAPKTKAITDVLSPDQARTFLELVRSAQQRADRETLEIRDEAGEVFGFLVLPVVHAPPPDALEDPAWIAELQRRLQSPEPAISGEEFLKLLDEWERAAEEGRPVESNGHAALDAAEAHDLNIQIHERGLPDPKEHA